MWRVVAERNMGITMASSVSPSSPPPSHFTSSPSKSSKPKPNLNTSILPTSINNNNPIKTQKTPIKSSPKKHGEKTTYPWSIPLHNKNPHAIYKDIQTFARKNQLNEALTLLDYVQKLGIPVNVTTLSAVISACIRLKSLLHAKQIHAHVRIHGLDNNEFIKTKLVQMYASCGSLDDANSLFVGDNDNVFAWNALLRGNVVAGGRRYRDLLCTFDRMREIGVEMNVYTYSCMIKSFSGAVAFRQGLKIHGLLIKNGFLGSDVIRTSLIDLYFKCGKMRLAHSVFDEMSERDVVVWGAMVAGFAHNNLKYEAIKYVRFMVEEGIMPNSVVLISVLPVIGEVGASKLGKEVHGYVLKKKNYSEQPFIKSAVIDMYCKCGNIDSGRKVFYSSSVRSIVSWTAMISGYISNGKLDQALRSIVWMQQEGLRPDVVSVATVLPVCAKLKALREGKEIHGYLMKSGFLPNVSLSTSLIVMYSKCGVFQYSRRLFDHMETRNVISWTAFIDSCTENRQPYEALEIFRAMQLSKHRADSVTISRVLVICNELELLKLGKEIHGQILKKDIERVSYISAGLMKFYGRCGMIEKAKSIFDLFPRHGSTTLTAMIAAYRYNSYFKEALALFYQMVDKGVLLYMNTFDEVLAICDQARFADESISIFQLMTRRYNMIASKEQYSLIAGLLRRSGRSEEAEYYALRSSSLES